VRRFDHRAAALLGLDRGLSVHELREYAPNEKAALDRLSGVVVRNGRDMREWPVKLVTPVRHMLKIEAIR